MNQITKNYKTNLKNVGDLLETLKGRITGQMMNGISPDALIQVAFNQCQLIPELVNCDHQSLWQALLQARALGILPDGYHGHLIPFKDKNRGLIVQFFPDYKGLVQLAYKNENNAVITGGVVYANDKFDFQLGSASYLHHQPALNDRGEFCAAWAMVKFANGFEEFVVLDKSQIDKRRATSKSAGSPFSPWNKWFDEMAKKTALKMVIKTVPIGEAVQLAAQHDSSIEANDASPIAIDIDYPGKPSTASARLADNLNGGDVDHPFGGDAEPEPDPKPKRRRRKKAVAKSEPDPEPVEDEPETVERKASVHDVTNSGPTVAELIRDDIANIEKLADLAVMRRSVEGQYNSGNITEYDQKWLYRFCDEQEETIKAR